MNEQEAKDLALTELRKRHSNIPPIRAVHAYYVTRGMSKGRAFNGWQVTVEYDIEMDPSESIVEIYDDSHEVVFVPMI